METVKCFYDVVKEKSLSSTTAYLGEVTSAEYHLQVTVINNSKKDAVRSVNLGIVSTTESSFTFQLNS